MLMESEPLTTAAVEMNVSRRHLLMGGALLATAALALAREPKVVFGEMAKGTLDKLIAPRIDKWTFATQSGLVLPPADPLKDSLYNDILTRVYTADNAPVIMLCIAYSNSQNGMLQLHRPEVCYPASGYRLSETKILGIPVGAAQPIPGHYFSAEGTSRSEQVLYWTRIGSEMPTHWIDQRAAVMRANLRRIIPDGILVRVSSPMADSEATLPHLEAFIKAMVAGLNPQAYKLLVSG